VLGRVGAGLVGVALLGGRLLLALGGFAGEHWGVRGWMIVVGVLYLMAQA
jgi:hypothetical protein